MVFIPCGEKGGLKWIEVVPVEILNIKKTFLLFIERKPQCKVVSTWNNTTRTRNVSREEMNLHVHPAMQGRKRA